MTLIETITVGSGGATSLEFTGIDGEAKDLLCLVSAIDPANALKQLIMNINDDYSNLSSLRLQGNGSIANSGTSTGSSGDDGISMGQITASGNTANTAASYSIYISNYAGSTPKSFSVEHAGENNATLAVMSIRAGLYDSTSPITSLQLSVQDSTFSEYSTASLYSIS